jgi:predicted SprT family Zn-dependent metalloprotease
MPKKKPPTFLTIELEIALLRELRATYQDINAAYFKRALKQPTIELSDATGRLGRWRSDVRAIEISRALVLEQSWPVVVEVLKHEMAHQYVYEVLGQTSETSHGPAFRDVCQRFGIDRAASGIPEAAGPRSDEDARILERIARLLALAESSNAHEAQAAMSAAQRLMLKHNLDVAKSQAPRDYSFRHLGKPTGRVSESERLLAAIIAQHFFVEVIWIPVYRPLEHKRGTVLEICGTRSNLDMAEYVHAFLTHTSEQLWLEHRRDKGIRSNRDRRTYLAGVMTGFLEQLNAQRAKNREQGLVWVQDADLSDYYRRRHPHIQRVRHQGNRRTEAHAHGRAAGRKIVLHRPVEGKASSAGRLLPPAAR